MLLEGGEIAGEAAALAVVLADEEEIRLNELRMIRLPPDAVDGIERRRASKVMECTFNRRARAIPNGTAAAWKGILLKNRRIETAALSRRQP
jgi:hypothetical protein